MFKVDTGTKCTKDYELLTVRLDLTGVKEIYYTFVYRPPDGDLANFITDMEILMYSITSKSNYEFNLIGDTNTNLNKTREVSVKKYRDFLKRNSLTNIIGLETCFNRGHGTLIDHFVTSDPHLYQQRGIVPIDVSDHYIIFGARKSLKNRTQKPN